MQNRCRECQSWVPDEDGRFGSCSSIAKRMSFKTADLDQMVFTSPSQGNFPVKAKMGYAFGCIHWRPKLNPNEPVAERTTISADELNEIMVRNGIRTIDLANRLGVKPQRVSDWRKKHRNVPKMAVSLMKLKGLL